MDDRHFDAVARTLASGRSRRQALRLLAAGALAAWLPRGAVAALALQECEAGLTYCEGSGTCTDLFSDPFNCGGCGVVCESGVCEAGACIQVGCPAGSVDCDGTGICTSLLDDPNHCGNCGTVCASGVCDGGFCAPLGCSPGLVACPYSDHFGPAGCYDLATDPNRCGSCETSCGGAGSRTIEACIEGSCVATGCLEGFIDCDGSGYCTSLYDDPNNCGACGVVCPSGVCSAGSCIADDTTCAAGLAYCPARQITVGFDNQPSELAAGCYDLFSDRLHCGSCDITCPTTVGCYGGECTLPPCEGGLSQCDGAGCVDLLTDPNHCGACDIVCAAGEVCEGGSCGPDTTCAAELTYCPAKTDPVSQPAGCYNLSSDYTHCGSCDTSCPIASAGPMACIEGQCQYHCETGLSVCSAPPAAIFCTDLRSDPNHCGACGVVCAAGDVCEAGACVSQQTACQAGLTYCPDRSDGQPAGCYDLSADYWHCGTCEMSCPTAGFHGVCSGGQCEEISCAAGLTYCSAQRNGLQPGCYDLATDRDHCGVCDVACAAGEVCEAGTCTATTTRATSDDPTPTTTRTITDETTREQEARGSRRGRETSSETQQGARGAGGATDATTETRPTRTPRTRDTAPEPGSADTAQAAAASVLAWPFDTEAGQWTIVHGYRAEDEDTTTVATPPAERGDFTRLALEFAVCPAEDVDAAEGTCDLGAAGSDPSWDREATQGSAVVSPVDGTVAWTDGETSCLAVGIDIAGHSGYRLALFNVEGDLERGQRVTRGKRIGRVARRGCERGGRIRMALYQPQTGTNDDPVAEREGVPFEGEWAIAGCDYPDDRRTVEQYREELVPCSPEDNTSPSS